MITEQHDRAVDAILTAEAILDQFKTLLPRLSSTLPADVSAAMGEAQSLYPELWANLDRARGLLRERRITVPLYDEARARQPASMLAVDVKLRETNNVAEAASWAAFLAGGAIVGLVASAAIDTVSAVGAKKAETNQSGLRDARNAIDALQSAMPNVPWKQLRIQSARDAAAAVKTFDRARNKKLLFGALGLGVAVAIGAALVLILQGSKPPTKEQIAAKEQAAFNAAKDEIRELNDVLRENPCDTASAERRVNLFVAHDQTRTARRLAKEYLDKCGEHAAMRAVAEGLVTKR